MSNQIILKRSATPSKVPTTSQLALGEIAINTYDGRIFIKKDSGSPAVVEIGGVTTVNSYGGAVVLNSDDISDSGHTNKWFTNAQARAAISGGTGITYSSSTGVITTVQSITTSATPTFAGLTLTGAMGITGNIIPSASNTYSLGSSSYPWKDVYVGPGTLYVNGKPVISDTSGTMTFSTDTDQNMRLTTAGTGVLQLGSSTTVTAVSGTLQIQSGKNITDSAGVSISFGNAINMNTSKITGLGAPSANTDAATKLYVDTQVSSLSTSSITQGNSSVTVVDTGTGAITLTTDGVTSLAADATGVTISGNLTVNGTTTTVNSNTINLADNIITLNSDWTGAPTQNAGVEVKRGDEANVQLRWNEGSTKWTFTNNGAVYYPMAVGTDDLAEGSTNQYFTTARARNSVSASSATGISYNSTTGLFSIGSIPNSALTNNTITINGSATALGGTRTLTTDDVLDTSATNKYFTNAQARGAVSVSGTGLAYNSGTGVISSNAASANTASTIVARDASGNFTAGTITATLSGNASTATTLASSRTIAVTGDISYSTSFDGSVNATGVATLATVNANAGAFGSATAIPVITVNGKGLITAISTTAVSIPSGALTFTGDVTGTGTTGSSTALSIASGAVTNAMLAGSIANSKLANSSTTVGTTAIALGASSTTLAGLTSVTSTSFVGALTGNASTVTNGVYTTDTGSVTNTMLAGSIANAKLSNSSVTVGSTAISLGGTATTIAGLSSVTSTSFVGALTGNASTVTNGVYTTDTGTVTSTMIANDTIVNADINSAAAIVDTKLATISTAGKVSNSATTATNLNTASAIVARDASGNFTAGTITAALTGNTTGTHTGAVVGNASTVTNGVYTTDTGTVTSTMIADGTIVNGDISASAAIAYSKLALTGAILNADLAGSIANTKLANSITTIGTTAIALGGSATIVGGLTSVTSTGFTGALTGNASTATALQTARAIQGVNFDGSAAITVVTAGTGVTVTGTSVAIGQAVGTSSNVTFNDLTVSGNLTVSGTTSTINSTTLDVADINITVAKGAASAAAANGAGLTVAGPATPATLTYSSADDRWNFNKSLNATLVGNVTGNVTGTAGSATGNAATATTLQTARLINGVSFNGSADVTVHTAGTGISISGTTVTNAGVTALTTSSGLSTNTSATGAVSITNTGVTSAVAGSGISVSGATGAVTITNSGILSISGTAPVTANTTSGATTISMAAATASVNGYMTTAYASKLDGIAAGATNVTNTNQLTNGAGYVTSSGVTAVTGTGPIVSSGGTTPAISIPAATASVNGYMTTAYASKLDGIAASATNVTNTNQLTNGAGYITGISSGNVTTALGYTPYNSTNPSGYTTNTGTVTSVATGNGLTGGTITSTGTLSMSGSYTGTFAVTGGITATGEVTAYYSDINLKKDIVEITDPIAKVMSLRGVTFRPNDTALALGITDKEEVGVIAQEVEAVLPQLVTASAFAGYKTVKYDKLTALLLEAVKAQQLQIDALRAEIAQLGGSAKNEL